MESIISDLKSQLVDFKVYFFQHNKQNTNVSTVDVGWHLIHSFKVVRHIIEALENSDSTTYKKSFKMIRFMMFLSGKIPRGKAKAPKVVDVSSQDITLEVLEHELDMALSKVAILETLDVNAFFEHPVIGNVNTK